MDSNTAFPVLQAIFSPGLPRLCLEWTGSILALVGAVLLALNRPWSKWAWPLWVVSNISLMLFGLTIGAYGLAAMQGGFMITSFVGCKRWLLKSHPTSSPSGAAIIGDAT